MIIKLLYQNELTLDQRYTIIEKNWVPVSIIDHNITQEIQSSDIILFKIDTVNYYIWRKINQIILNHKPMKILYQNTVTDVNNFIQLNNSKFPELYEQAKLDAMIYSQVIQLNKDIKAYLAETKRAGIPEDLDYVLENYAWRYDIQIPKDNYKEKMFAFYNNQWNRSISVDIGNKVLDRLKIYDSIMFYMSINEPFDTYLDEELNPEDQVRIKYYGNMELLDSIIEYNEQYTSKGHRDRRLEHAINR